MKKTYCACFRVSLDCCCSVCAISDFPRWACGGYACRARGNEAKGKNTSCTVSYDRFHPSPVLSLIFLCTLSAMAKDTLEDDDDVLNVNVGVLGHVNSGKTSLVKALPALHSPQQHWTSPHNHGNAA